MAQEQQELERSTFLPRISMFWFFVAILMAAIALWIIRNANQGFAMAAAIIFCLLIVLVFFSISTLLFGIATVFGSTKHALDEINQETESPFSHDHLPDQIVPPRQTDTAS